MKVGICGAGIAGPTLAYWLVRGGHEVHLVERAPGLRTGGYIVDFWGVGYDVAERMGIVEQVRGRGYQVEEVRLVGASGETAGGFSADVFRRMTGDRFTSVARSDLAAVIFDAVKSDVEVSFADTVVAVEPRPEAVTVQLASGGSRRYDLLVAADGLHSAIRGLAWGEQQAYERQLGYYVAAFEVTGYPRRDDNVYVSHAEPGRSMSRFSLRGDRTLFLLVFEAAGLNGPEPVDDAGRRQVLHRVFGNSGWEAAAILDALDRTPQEIYFDRVSQIETPRWSMDRQVLIGDAAACVSLLAGEGTGLAMTQAWVLAGELNGCGDAVEAALGRYEARLRPFIEAKQKSARNFASSFAPSTATGIRVRRIATRLMRFRPVADRLIGASVRDDFVLPEYSITRQHSKT